MNHALCVNRANTSILSGEFDLSKVHFRSRA
jgi:hypothetical protein